MTSDATSTAGERPDGTAPEPLEHPTFDTSVAHIARVYDYWLGGKDNFAADRAAGEQVIAAYPASSRRSGPTGRSCAGPCATWPARPASGSSSTSAPASRPRQHARGRPGRRAGSPGRLRGQRPDRAGARPGAAGQHPGGRDRLHRRRPARPGQDPGAGRADPRLHPAGRGHADRDAAPDHRRRRPLPDRGPADRRGPPGSYLALSHVRLRHRAATSRPRPKRVSTRWWHEK